MIDLATLEHDADRLAADFRTAEPFPHVVIEHLYEPEMLSSAVAAFPTPDAMTKTFHNSREFKSETTDLERAAPPLRAAFEALESPAFLHLLTDITGIPDLVADPHRLGAGLHQSTDGMYLDVHADFNRHSVTGWFRRLNILVYLDDWTDCEGGILQLWPASMTGTPVTVAPAFNRALIFETTSTSFHGYETIITPDGRPRRSLAAYYYTAEPPPSYNGVDHDTEFRLRPGQVPRRQPLRDAKNRVGRRLRRIGLRR